MSSFKLYKYQITHHYTQNIMHNNQLITHFTLFHLIFNKKVMCEVDSGWVV